MRILTWCYSFWPGRGGLERIVPQVTLGLAERGHELVVICQTMEEATNLHGLGTLEPGIDSDEWNHFGPVELHRVPITSCLAARDAGGLARITAQVRALQHSFAPDVVHMAMCGTEGVVALATAGTTPWVLSNHLYLAGLPSAATGLHIRMLRRSDRILTVSESARRDTVSLVPELADRMAVTYNGVPLTADPVPVPVGPPTILTHGRLVAEKGFATALTAHALLLDRWPDARLVIAGDGYARQGLELLATKLGLADRVTFTGWVSEGEIRDLVDAATVVVVPSCWSEPFGLTALDAAERGRPVVASRIGGLPEVVVDGVTGVLVQAGDPISLAAAVDKLLADPALAAALGRAARERVHADLSLEACIDRYDAALTATAEGQAPA